MKDDLVERIRSRPHDAPMPTEHLMDEAANALEAAQKRIAELEARIRKAKRELQRGGDLRDCITYAIDALSRAALTSGQGEGS